MFSQKTNLEQTNNDLMRLIKCLHKQYTWNKQIDETYEILLLPMK